MECSAAWDALSAFGTATQASSWVALEQPGPWGREALTESHLDPALGARLASAASEAGGRVLLIRAPGQHADRAASGPRRVFVAGGLASTPWLLSGEVADPCELEQLPWAALAASDPAPALESCGWLRRHDVPVLLVCANSRRDVCCALRGRPVALDVGAARPGQVWECSHTGGHRFAPTGLVLPLGQMLARLTPGLASEVLDAAAPGRLAPGALGERHDRGRSHLPAELAAAESWVRVRAGVCDPGALTAEARAEGVRVRHADGRTWDVGVTETTGPALPESCGKAPKPSRTWVVRAAPGAAPGNADTP